MKYGYIHKTTKEKGRQTIKERWRNDEDFRAKMFQMYKSRVGQKRTEEFVEKQRKNAKGNTNVRGYAWYTNGINDTRYPEGKQPDGYYRGRSSKKKGEDD